MYKLIYSSVSTIGGHISQSLLHQRLGHPATTMQISSLSIDKSSSEDKSNKVCTKFVTAFEALALFAKIFFTCFYLEWYKQKKKIPPW